jgi:hypothetical protein
MATYTVVPNGAGAFAVEIRHSGGVQITGGFKTEAEAQAWMAERQAEDAKRGKKRAKAGRGD